VAKFANVTYGTGGATKEYTYVVNDSVRLGDIIQPSVVHYKSKKVFGTTGIVQSTAKETSTVGQKVKQKAESEMADKGNTGDIAEALTAKDIGLAQERTAQGTYATNEPLGKTVRGETGRRAVQEGREFELTARVATLRQANVEARQASENFDSYSQAFLPKGD